MYVCMYVTSSFEELTAMNALPNRAQVRIPSCMQHQEIHWPAPFRPAQTHMYCVEADTPAVSKKWGSPQGMF